MIISRGTHIAYSRSFLKEEKKRKKKKKRIDRTRAYTGNYANAEERHSTVLVVAPYDGGASLSILAADIPQETSREEERNRKRAIGDPS